MVSFVFFSLSGLAIVTLIATKRLEETQKRSFFIFNLISKGDIHIRAFHHLTVRLYSEGKEKLAFFLQRQIQMHSKNLWHKLMALLKEKREQYIGNIRNSRLLKKSDGISEFFKNMSSIEKGNGEIHDVLPNDSQENKKELD